MGFILIPIGDLHRYSPNTNALSTNTYSICLTGSSEIAGADILLARPLKSSMTGQVRNYLGNGLGKPAEEATFYHRYGETVYRRAARIGGFRAQAFCDVVVHVVEVAQRHRTETLRQ